MSQLISPLTRHLLLRAIGLSGGVLAILQLRHLSGPWSGALCGPWGCGPTLEALLACHLAWIVLLTPGLIYVCRRCQPQTWQRVGRALLGLGGLGLLFVAIQVGVDVSRSASGWENPWLPQRFLFRLAGLVELPTVQLIVSGAALMVGARLRRGNLGAAAELSGSAPSVH